MERPISRRTLEDPDLAPISFTSTTHSRAELSDRKPHASAASLLSPTSATAANAPGAAAAASAVLSHSDIRGAGDRSSVSKTRTWRDGRASINETDREKRASTSFNSINLGSSSTIRPASAPVHQQPASASSSLIARSLLEKDRLAREIEKERERIQAETLERERGREREREARVNSRQMSRTGATSASAKDTEKDSAKKKLSSSDAWRHLASKEQKPKVTKLQGTEKTLLGLLEEERARYTQLEDEYHKLLVEVQNLQTSHLQDLRNFDKRSDADMKSLQKALVLKTEECGMVQRELQQFHGRYAKESASWISANDKLEAQVIQMERLCKEMEVRGDAQEKAMQELSRSKKELADRLGARDAEIKRLTSQSRETEAEFVKEKENRMKLEVQAMQLDHFLAQRDDEIKSLNIQLKKRDADVEELTKSKIMLDEARKGIDELVRREKLYMDEIEQASSRERKLFSELEESSRLQQRTMAELERSTQREGNALREVESLKVTVDKLRNEASELHSKLMRENEEIASLSKQNHKHQFEATRLAQEIINLRATVQELRGQLQRADSEIMGLKDLEFQLRREKEEAKGDLVSVQNQISLLQQQLQESALRLEGEVASKNELKQQNKEKLIVVAEKMSDLQDALGETQQQLRDLRQTDESLRANLRQRDETIEIYKRQINEQQQEIAEMQSNLARESYLNESLKVKKKEEVMVLQEKLSSTKMAMDNETNTLRSQLAQRNIQAANLTDEIGRLKIDVSELSADKFRLEARLSELTAMESSHSRQVANLQQQIRQRDQDISLLTIKYQSVVDQLKRVDDELQTIRSDGDIQKVGDLSRRLKMQVGILLDKDIASPLFPVTDTVFPQQPQNQRQPLNNQSSSAKVFKSTGQVDRNVDFEHSYEKTESFSDLLSFRLPPKEAASTGAPQGFDRTRSAHEMSTRDNRSTDNFERARADRQRERDLREREYQHQQKQQFNSDSAETRRPVDQRNIIGIDDLTFEWDSTSFPSESHRR